LIRETIAKHGLRYEERKPSWILGETR
jgi:hypothetical protein